jgi:hypothetical protein
MPNRRRAYARRAYPTAGLALALVLAGACKGERRAGEPEAAGRAEARISEVELGRQVNTAHEIEQPTDTFAPGDTLFASVKTEDTPVGTRILGRWVYTEGGAEQVIAEETLTTDQPGTGYTSFHATNASPWPAGSYELRVGLNGEIKETKGFSVRG